jgi:hypothetical protein
MDIYQHPATNMVLTPPEGLADVVELPVVAADHLGCPSLISFWTPNQTELDMINAGNPVALIVLGGSHPPVIVTVGTTGKEGNDSTMAEDVAVKHAPARQAMIDKAVSKFLGWQLPADFAPDCYVSFNPVDGGSWPIGTNLLNAEQARAMLEAIL